MQHRLTFDAWGTPTEGSPDPFGFAGELHSEGLLYLRARWYDPSSGTFTSRDPFDGYPQQPYSLHPYQYGYSNPVRWTDPSGEFVTCTFDPVRGLYCEFWSAEDWSTAGRGVQEDFATAPGSEYILPATDVGIDFVPVVGDVKGIAEVFTGCDLVTGEELGNWRYAGLLGFVGLAELRHLRHADVALPALNRLRTHFEQTASGADAICYACVLNTLDPGRYPYEDVRFMAPNDVIPALQELGFRQASDLQPGDVVVWLARGDVRGYPDDFPTGFLTDSVDHIGIYLGEVNGTRVILSGNWPPGARPGMYNMDELLRVQAPQGSASLDKLPIRYYRPPNE